MRHSSAHSTRHAKRKNYNIVPHYQQLIQVIQVHGLPTFAREDDYIHTNTEMLTYADMNSLYYVILKRGTFCDQPSVLS